MRREYQILLSLLWVTSFVSAQVNQVEPYFVKSRNFDIQFEDTLIQASVLTLPTGEFSFRYGNDVLHERLNWVRLIGKGKNSKTVEDTLIKSDKPDLLIESYFPLLFQDSTKVLIAPDYGVTWFPHHHYEFRYTYLLSQSGFEPLYKSERDSTLRIIFKELGVDHAKYEIFTIDLSGDDFLFHRKKVKHTYSESFETIEEVMGKVKKEKAISRFYEEFNKYDFSDSSYFVKYDGSHDGLFEFKTSDNYSAILRPHVTSRGQAADKALTWTMYDLWGWTLDYNRKEEKRKRKEQKKKK